MQNKFTIQDIFQIYGEEYIQKHNLSHDQWKVFNAIKKCGTEKLGYHLCTCKNVEKNILDTTHVVIYIVQCVKIMLEKNGFKKNLVIC